LAKTLATNVNVTSIAVDDTHAYFTGTVYSGVDSGGVFKVPIGGGVPVKLDSNSDPYNKDIGSLQVVGGTLYWSDNEGVWLVGTAGGTAFKILETGGDNLPPHNLIYATGPGDDYRLFHINHWFENVFALSPSLIFWNATELLSDQDGFNYYPYSLTADSTRVYFMAPGGRIYSIPRTGGTTPVFLAQAASKAIHTTDGVHVYFFRGTSIQRVPVQGGPVRNFASGYADVADMVIDDGTLYFVCSSCGTVMKQALNATQAFPLAIQQNSPRTIAVHGNRVYFGTQNSLKSVAK
jgi:hypothetical protein